MEKPCGINCVVITAAAAIEAIDLDELVHTIVRTAVLMIVLERSTVH
jgi:hypothetical protein